MEYGQYISNKAQSVLFHLFTMLSNTDLFAEVKMEYELFETWSIGLVYCNL